jgi:peptide/nickel transport system substrate-binding protein
MKRAAAALLIFACAHARAETRAAYGGGAVGALMSAPVDPDPLSTNPGDLELAQLVFDAPFRVDGAGRVRPHLALALDVDRTNPLRARLRLRPDVRFHDGTPLRAKDVAASFARALASPAGWTLAPIRAARAVGDDVVELELVRPAPDLALLLATPAASVTPAGAHRAVGSGPFRLDGFDATMARLAAHATCFAGRPYLDGVSLRAFDSRTVEAAQYDVGALQVARHGGAGFGAGVPGGALAVEGPVAITGFLAFGRDLPAATTLRAAFALGVNRDHLRRLSVRERAEAATSPAPPALGGVRQLPALDPDRARQMIDGLTPAQRNLSLLVDKSRLEDHAIAERLIADLGNLGVTLKVDKVDAAVYQQRVQAGAYELVLGESLAPAPDGGLAELALLASVDPQAARAQLGRAPAAVGAVNFSTVRVLPLFHRAARLHRAAELRGLAVDAAGRASWADAHWRR